MNGDQTLNIIIKAKDQATTTLNKFKGTVEGMQPAFQKMAAIGTAAFVGLAAVAKSSLSAYAESEAQLAKTDAVLKTLIGTSKTVVIGQKDVATGMKLTAKETEGVKIKIEEQELALKNLSKKLKNDKISRTEYDLAVRKTKNIIDTLKDSLVETTTKTVDITKVIKFSGGSFEELQKKVRNFGTQLQKMGGIADEAGAEGIAKLMQITLDYDKAQEAAMIAADLAKYKNIDYSTSIDVVSKVLSGNVGILGRYGIAVKEGTTATEALGLISDKVKGQYEAFGKTLEGRTLIMKESIGDLKESIGKALVPAVSKLIETVQPLIEKFAAWAEKNPELLSKIILIGGAVTALVAGVGLLGVALPGIIAGFTLLLGPVGLAMVAIGALTFAIVKAGEVFKYTKEDWKLVWTGIKMMFKDGVNFLIGLAENWANMWVKAVNAIIGALNKIHFSIPSWVPGVGGKSFGINIGLVKEISLPRFEHGGMIQGARGTEVPIIAHGGETIIPAGKGKSGGGANIIINMNYPQFKNQDDVDVVREQIENALRDVVRVYKLKQA